MPVGQTAALLRFMTGLDIALVGSSRKTNVLEAHHVKHFVDEHYGI